MKKKTQQCQFCKRFFKRVKGRHELFCTHKPINEVRTYNTKFVYSLEDLQGAERAGREAGSKEAMERVKNRLDDVKIKALDAAAKAVDAIAHMMGDM